MIANLLKSRRSRKLRRRKGYRPLVEQLEDRRLLATLVFDTELVSLDLTGGPYPMPLASDPGNANFPDVGGGLAADGGLASDSGYGFVDAAVSITLSSQRPADAPIPGPGPPSTGIACATNDPGGPDGTNRECLFGAPPPQDNPIDPAELDGQTFQVDSFFDVFFDITVTDVDDRPGRDFAGQGDGASFLLPNNGPAHMIAQGYLREFDVSAPNFGLIPPPQLAPYIGHFQIEIPLGGDINGNANPDGSCVADPTLACNDKIKFTIASHAAGDENRTFTTLPDGTVIDEFDSAAFLAGAIVDESTDPPFTIGAGSPAAPAFSGPGALTGPTTATSTLLNPVINLSYVDANNNQLFEPGFDVALVAGELADGEFSTTEAEGGYATVIPGAGLFVGVGVSVAKDLEFQAEGDLVVSPGLTLNAGKDLELKAGLDINVSGATLLAGREIELEAGGNIDVAGATLSAGRDVELKARGEVDGDNLTFIDAGRDVEVKAKQDVFVDGASITAGRDVEIKARGEISMVIATITAGKDIELKAKLDIDADEATMIARRNIELKSKEGDVSVSSSSLNAGKSVKIEALDEIFANDSSITAGKEIELEALLIDIAGADLTARKIKIEEG